jgi:8-oxo-dGTP pyrophosphatase MutT (NUDIX family)
MSSVLYTPRYTQEYSVGFAFSPKNMAVVLIRKERPAWQKGKLNGVGGHVEANESPAQAMVREYQEETGVQTALTDWELFAVMHGIDWPKDPTGKLTTAVYCYETRLPEAYRLAKTQTDESIHKVPTSFLHAYAEQEYSIPNLTVLIPLALSKGWFQRPVELLWAPPTT